MKVSFLMPEPPYNWESAKYPILGTADDGHIVIFYKYQCGVLIHPTSDISLHHSQTWDMPSFKPLNKTILIGNN